MPTSNDGKKIVLTLKEINTANGNAPTGATKPNTVGDPDYEAPYVDTTACPLSTTPTCPTTRATGTSGGTHLIYFEMSVLNSTMNISGLAKIKVTAVDSGSVEQANVVFTLPNATANYFSGSLAAPNGTYSLRVDYLTSANAVITTCPASATNIVVS